MKIRINKVRNFWRITYYAPFAGFIYSEHRTWDEAINEVPVLINDLTYGF